MSDSNINLSLKGSFDFGDSCFGASISVNLYSNFACIINFLNSGIFSTNCVAVFTAKPSISFILFIFSSFDVSSVIIFGSPFKIIEILFSPNPLPKIFDAPAIIASSFSSICFWIEL